MSCMYSDQCTLKNLRSRNCYYTYCKPVNIRAFKFRWFDANAYSRPFNFALFDGDIFFCLLISHFSMVKKKITVNFALFWDQFYVLEYVNFVFTMFTGLILVFGDLHFDLLMSNWKLPFKVHNSMYYILILILAAT